MSNRSQVSETKTNGDDQHSLIKKQEDQPCFPTHSDRLAFIDHSSIGDRCVGFYFQIFNFLFILIYRKCYKII
jgi:hypothetical protein